MAANAMRLPTDDTQETLLPVPSWCEDGDQYAVTSLRSLSAPLQLFSPAVAALVLLSLSSALLGAQAGKVTGQFYAALLDEAGQRAFWQVVAKAAAWFAAAALAQSCTKLVSEQLALQWRHSLTGQLQDLCVQRHGYFQIGKNCDNLDQRVLQDVINFCTQLSRALPILAAAPFKAVFYSVWVAELTSKASLAAIYAFFLVGIALQRCWLLPCCCAVLAAVLVRHLLRPRVFAGQSFHAWLCWYFDKSNGRVHSALGMRGFACKLKR